MESKSVSQSIGQSSNQPMFQDCLLVSRHTLLATQEEDLHKICKKITKVDSLPTDPVELRKLIDFYDAVVGTIPLPLQLNILQSKRSVLTFEMQSIGTTKTKEEALDLLMKSGKDGVILPPSHEGEPYRVSIYRGIRWIKEIKVVDVPITQH